MTTATTKPIDVNGQIFNCPDDLSVWTAAERIRSQFALQGGAIQQNGTAVKGTTLINTLTGNLAFVEGIKSATKAFINRLDILTVEGSPEDIPAEPVAVFEPFIWHAKEEDDMSRARDHLHTQLNKFGIGLEARKGHFVLFDVHTNKSILDVQDKKTGYLSGGTDLIIAPYGITEFCVARQSCVTIELKTLDEVTEAKGLNVFLTEATLELIASAYKSNHLPIVLLTDMSHHAMILEFVYRASHNRWMIVCYTKLTLSQAAQMIANHLAVKCKPIAGIRYTDSDHPCHEELVAFKKARRTPLEESEGWVNIYENIEDSEED